MLLADRFPKILFLQRDAMLERALQFGNRPQHVNLAGRAPILEAGAPFLPVLAHILQFLRFAIKRGHLLLMGTVARRGFLPQRAIVRRQRRKRAIGLAQRLQRRLHAAPWRRG